jgi:hypothetical protein
VVFARRVTLLLRPARSTGWANAVDRLARAVHRYGDRIEMIPDRRLRQDLRDLGDQLNEALADVRHVPRGRRARGARSAVAVRAMLRAGTLCAQATEAALIASDAGRRQQPDEVARQLQTVRELAAAVRELTDTCLEPQR